MMMILINLYIYIITERLSNNFSLELLAMMMMMMMIRGGGEGYNDDLWP